MPLLRRRGNAASEADMRHRHGLHSKASSEDAQDRPASPRAGPNENDEDASYDVDSHDMLEPSDAHEDPVSRQQSRVSTASRPASPPIQEQSSRHRRFSILRFRNASDSQLSLRAKQQAEHPPPVPRPPEIITTAPTNDITMPKKKPSRISLAARFRFSSDLPRNEPMPIGHGPPQFRKSFNDDRSRPSLSTVDEPLPPVPQISGRTGFNGAGLHASAQRQSESSRSDSSSVDPTAQSNSSTTPKKSTGTASSFLRLRRAKKAPEPLFPLSHLPQKDKTPPAGVSSQSLGVASTPRPSSTHSNGTSRRAGQRSEDVPRAYPSPAAALFAGAGSRSGHSSPTRAAALRGRSSTMSSLGRNSTDDHLLPPTTRTSSSTGRKSFGDLFGLSRIRQNSELSRQGTLTPATPGSVGSKSNSLQLTRDSITLPERREDESASKYLARVEEVVSRSVIAATLSKNSDPFSAAVLRSYMRSFSFFGDPMDMALRKLLMEAELPKETQHIDRCLQAFANRYHECNPGIYATTDQAYFLAFSLLILHTDVFNKNNKYKMQKADYLKNTHDEGIFDDILECFYDNICYTPFIRVEDEIDLSEHRIAANKPKKKQILSAAATNDPAKRAAKEPVDPYTLILDGNLDALRPNLKDAMELDDHYNYLGTASSLNLKDLQKTFFRTGVLQIVSARSRPDAFMTEKTVTNPEVAHPGIVDIKVTKVGLLWRKDAKKRKTRSPWQEWGAILTGAQLYLFRNVSWVKNLMHQYESHIKSGHDGIPVIFKPPLEEFKPDALLSTHGAVALLDTSYKKHKNAFVYVQENGFDEVLLADNEEEMNDWLATLNYAAAFRTSGVRMRGVIGGNYDGQGRRGIRRLDNAEGTQLVQTPSGPVTIVSGRIDQKMADDIQVARRDFMKQKIAEAEAKLEQAQKRLDKQLRNARHLHILAPIQPRTRDQLLSAAARLAAQLRWTRSEIWRAKCHRDILYQDLKLDSIDVADATSSLPVEQSPSSAGAPTSSAEQASAAKEEQSSLDRTGTGKKTQTPASLRLSLSPSIVDKRDVESPLDQIFQTPPQSATKSRHLSHDLSQTGSNTGTERRESASSMATSPVPSPSLMPQVKHLPSIEADKELSVRRPSQGADDVDAEERLFLEKAGLLDAKSSHDPAKKTVQSAAGEGPEYSSPAERDRAERNKVRRSLHRTLRESAGQLSHHRSRKGKELAPHGTLDDVGPESKLARSTGSFVVHGKKASVIQLGTELQDMSQDEKIRHRKSQQQQHVPQSGDVRRSLLPTGVDDDDEFHSVAGDAVDDAVETSDHRGSNASASTATARSFRDLHRKYSSAQAARSVSASARLVIPSDGESEAAVSFSDGRRSPLPPIENESQDEEEDQDEHSVRGRAPSRGPSNNAEQGREREEDGEGDVTDEDSSEE